MAAMRNMDQGLAMVATLSSVEFYPRAIASAIANIAVRNLRVER
jgi:hypothetical protein